MNAESFSAVVRLVCTLVSGIAAVFGAYLDADVLAEGVFCAVALVCLIVTWWKNNNVTEAAQTSQKVLDALKTGEGLENLVPFCEADESAADEYGEDVPNREWTKAMLLEWCEENDVEAYESWNKTKIMLAIANSGKVNVDLSDEEVEE